MPQIVMATVTTGIPSIRIAAPKEVRLANVVNGTGAFLAYFSETQLDLTRR